MNCKLGQDFLDRQLSVLCKMNEDFLDIQYMPYFSKTSNIQMSTTKKSSYSSVREYYENSEYFRLYIKSLVAYLPHAYWVTQKLP